jgi:uncharacterized protein with GYD domain
VNVFTSAFKEGEMPGYIMLFKYTKEGLASVREGAERAKRAQENLAKLGVRTIGLWWTLGEIDGVGVFEAPNDQAIATAALAAASQGVYTSHTMRAFSEEEFAQIVSSLP